MGPDGESAAGLETSSSTSSTSTSSSPSGSGSGEFRRPRPGTVNGELDDGSEASLRMVRFFSSSFRVIVLRMTCTRTELA
jgi:hypothetical protein